MAGRVQYLLANDGKGHFTDITDSMASDLKNIGMVTDARWIDYDGDNDKDLVVTGEWMNISVFRNDNGHLTDATASAGLSETSGWWNCVQIADVDGDGDQDLICGNLGLNSLLKATLEEPVTMYLNDFDKNGSLDQLICSYQDGKSYPVASLDELAAQITGLDKKYPKYSDFGGQTAEDIFGRNVLEQSVVKKAVMFESSLFINNGDGTFKTKKLPVYAQFSPVRDILAKDLNGDGISDLILVGNDYSVRPSYGQYDASYGWFMTGSKNIEFKTVMPGESDFVVKGDSRKISELIIKGHKYLVVGINNGEIITFLIK